MKRGGHILRKTPVKRGPKKPRGFAAVHCFDRKPYETVMQEAHPHEGKAFLRRIAKGSPLIQAAVKALKPRTRIRSRSPAKAADDRKYAIAKAEHFEVFPRCMYPGCVKSLLNGDAMDLHHRGGRRGPLLYCKRYFATACRPHHNLAKDKPKQSRDIGWVIDVSSDEVQALKQTEILES